MTLVDDARTIVAKMPDGTPRIHLSGAILVFEAACAMDDFEPDKAPRVAVAWGRLKALVETYRDAS